MQIKSHHDRFIRVHGFKIFIAWSGRGYVSSTSKIKEFCLEEELPNKENLSDEDWKTEMQLAENRLVKKLRILTKK